MSRTNTHKPLHPTQEMDPVAPAIEVRGLHKSFGDKKVLTGIDSMWTTDRWCA